MLELGSIGEIVLIAAAALILIGPKELPTVMRTAGRFAQRMRTMSAGFRQSFDQYFQEGMADEFARTRNQEVLRDTMMEEGEPPEPRPKKAAKKPAKKRVVKKS